MDIYYLYLPWSRIGGTRGVFKFHKDAIKQFFFYRWVTLRHLLQRILLLCVIICRVCSIFNNTAAAASGGKTAVVGAEREEPSSACACYVYDVLSMEFLLFARRRSRIFLSFRYLLEFTVQPRCPGPDFQELFATNENGTYWTRNKICENSPSENSQN